MRNLAAWIVDVEGGLVNNPDDPGGLTKYGISQRAYPNLDIANLSVADAMAIYDRDYIQPVAARVDDDRMLWLVADAAVQHGLSRALEWLDSYPDFDSYLMRRIRFYTRLSTFDHFGRGWMKRIAKLLEAVSRLNSPQVVEVINDHRDLTTRLLAAVRGTSGPAVTRTRALTDGNGVKLDIA